MSLTPLTPASVTDVIDLASVKAMLGIEDSASDAVLAMNIKAMTSGVREFFGRELAWQTYEEVFTYEDSSGRPRDRIKLACNPVDPSTVSVSINGFPLTSWYVEDAEAGMLVRDPIFGTFSSGFSSYPQAPGDWRIKVAYDGGFAYATSDWSANTTVKVGAWVRSSAPTFLRFICTTAGTTGSVEPSWPTVGLTVTDGTAVWTARQAGELPAIIPQLTYFAIRDAFEAADRPSDVIRSEGEGNVEMYARSGAAGTMSTEVLAALAPLRARYGR
jgi:hypothetical protein